MLDMMVAVWRSVRMKIDDDNGLDMMRHMAVCVIDGNNRHHHLSSQYAVFDLI